MTAKYEAVHKGCYQCEHHFVDPMSHEIIECITGALDAKDSYTAGHSQRVSDMAHRLCELLGLTDREVMKIHIAAHLHDIGKIGVPDAVLNKEGKLTDDEWSLVKKHPQIGANILSKSQSLSELAEIVLHHHERVDGKGYPDGLKGDEIPFGAKVIAVCDSIDAMTSDRKYRKALGWDICYEEIKSNLGTMYDKLIGQCALENWSEIRMAAEDYHKS